MACDGQGVTTVTTSLGSPYGARAGSQLPKQVVTVVTRVQKGVLAT